MQNGHSEPVNEQSRKLKQLVDEAKEKGRELLNEGIENAKGIFEEKSAEFKKKASELGLDKTEQGVRSYVKKNPWKAVGIAVFVGVVLGRLFSSSDRD